MKPVLPRILLWQDLDLLEMQSEPLFDELCEVLRDINNYRLEKIPQTAVVFNEVYYQSTRLIYENKPDPDLGMLELDVKANVGSKSTAEIVFRLIFCLLTARKDNSINIDKFLLNIFSYYGMNSEPGKKFSVFIQKHKKGIKHYMSFTPRPVKAGMLSYQGLNWDKITSNYNFEVIEEIVNLWSEEDRVAVINDIERAYQSYKLYVKATYALNNPKENQPIEYDNEPNFNVLRDRVRDCEKVLVDAKNHFPIERTPTFSEQLKERDEEIITLKKANIELRSQIEQLRSNNNEAQIEKNRERSFTFARIVEHCNTLPREERRYITGMLNKFLRDDCNVTPEECKILNELDNYSATAMTDIVFGNKNLFDGSSLQIAVDSKGQLDIKNLLKILSPDMIKQIKEEIEING